ncbi:hypothetical protein PSPL106493_23005 [Pseudomonas plecoglossicida]
MRQRGLSRGLCHANAGTGAVGGDGPADLRAKAPTVGRRLAEVFEDTDGADLGTEADIRVQRTRRHADGRGGSRQLAFGLAHVWAPLEQRSAIADRHQLVQVRQLGAIGGTGRQLLDRLGQQRCQGIHAGLALGLEARQFSAQRLELGLRAGDLGLIAAARIAQALVELHALLLQVERLAGDVVFLVGRAHLGVGLDHIRHQGDPRGVGGSLHGIGIGLGRFGAALEGAPQVELVRGADDGLADIGYRDFLRQQEGFARLLQTLRAGLDAATETALRLGHFNLGAGLGDVGRRHAQLGVGTQRLTYQLVEPLILIELPPVLGHRRRHHAIGILAQRAVEVAALHRRLFRHFIVRANHHAGPQRQT